MNEATFRNLMKLENLPKKKEEKYFFLVDNEALAQNIIMAQYRSVELLNNREYFFSVDSFIKCIDELLLNGTSVSDCIFVLSCGTKKNNDRVEQFFRTNHIKYKMGWRLFKGKGYLENSENVGILKKIIFDFIEQYEPENLPVNMENLQENVLSLISYKPGRQGEKKIIQSVRNVEIILENDQRFHNKIRFDEFSQQTYLVGDVPWETKDNYRAWSSYDDSALFSIIQSEYEISNRNDYFDAVKNVSMKNRFHPVREQLDSFEWDGKEHIRSLLPEYLGATDDEYSFQVMRLFLLGAVSRVYQPGCKFDYTMILQGPQGLGKSTFLQLLALSDEWFNDSLDSLDSDKSAQSLMGSWIIELAELKSLARTAGGVDSVKRFLTATQDKYRVPYERRADIFLRQCVFAGTTNKSDFLQDETGNRRFLIIQTGVNEPKKNLFAPDVMDDIKAAWAQAVHIFKTEHPKLVLPDSCRERAEELQKESMADDGKIGIIAEYLADKQRTCAIQIWNEALKETGRPQKWQASEINNIVLGFPDWEKIPNPTKFEKYGSQRGFQKCSKKNLQCRPTERECSSEFVEIDSSQLSECPFV